MNAAELTEQDLDMSAGQVFFAMQEASDNAHDTISPDAVGNWNIHGKNIVNLAEGIEPHHGVNKKQLDAKDARWTAIDNHCTSVLSHADAAVLKAESWRDQAQGFAQDAQREAQTATEQAATATEQASKAEQEANHTAELKVDVDATKALVKQQYDDVITKAQQVTSQRDEIKEIRTEVDQLAQTTVTAKEDGIREMSDIERRINVQKERVDAGVTTVGNDKAQVKIWRDEAEQFRDDAAQVAGKATNYVVDYGEWLGASKGQLPPKPLTSGRWRFALGGEIPELGLVHGGDYLYYSVKSDKFHVEGDIRSVNGRNGTIILDAHDVGAYSKTEVYNKVESDEKYPLKTEVYNKAQSDDKFYSKADVYTKTEADSHFALLTHNHTWAQLTGAPRQTLYAAKLTDAAVAAPNGTVDLRPLLSAVNPLFVHDFDKLRTGASETELIFSIPDEGCYKVVIQGIGQSGWATYATAYSLLLGTADSKELVSCSICNPWRSGNSWSSSSPTQLDAFVGQGTHHIRLNSTTHGASLACISFFIIKYE